MAAQTKLTELLLQIGGMLKTRAGRVSLLHLRHL